MFRTRYAKFLILATAAAAAACATDPAESESAEKPSAAAPASLTIDFSVPDLGIGVSARAGTDSGTEYTFGEKMDPDHPERMDEEAALVNGNKMTCLAVLLVHRETNKLVGVRELPLSASSATPDGLKKNGFLDANGEVDPALTSGSRARVTFEYDAPLHAKDGKSVERLLRGEYQLFAVANYQHLIPTSKANPQPDQGTQADQPLTSYETIDLDKTLGKILDDFRANPDEGLGGFNPGYEYFYKIRFLMNCTLRKIAGTEDDYEVIPMEDKDGNLPYIRAAVMQTLSSSQNIFLKDGQNNISVEMLRISSRTRVEVKNYSTSYPLKVHSLTFSPNYTQSTNFLFRRDNNENNYVELERLFGDVNNPGDGQVTAYHSFKGAPVVSFDGITSETTGYYTRGAIVPFANNMDLDNDGVMDCVGVPAGGKTCIFDALMYESCDADTPFSYTIDVSYPTVKNYRTTDPNKIDMETCTLIPKGGFDYALEGGTKYLTFSDVDKFIEEVEKYPSEESSDPTYCFLVQGLKTKRFLQETADGKLYAQKLNDDKIHFTKSDIKTYLWKLKIDKSGEKPVCELINLNSGKYLPPVPADKKMYALQEAACQHMLDVDGGKNAVLFATYHTPAVKGHNMYYLNVFGELEHLGGWYDGRGIEEGTKDDDNSKFRLYPVKTIPAYEGSPRMKKEVVLTAFSDKTAYVEEVHEIQRNDFVRILVEVSYNPQPSDFMFKPNPWDPRTGTVDFH